MEADEYRRIAAAEERHWWYVGMRGLLESLAGDLIPTTGGRFLDAGCGPGGNGQWMADRGQLVGMDVMPEAIEFASEKHTEMNLCLATVEALPFADETFDALQSITILTHAAVGNINTALREYLRVLRPGGVALIAEPAFRVLARSHDRVVHAVRRYRRGELAAAATSAGFEVGRTTYAYSFLFPVALALAAKDRVRPLATDKSDLERGESGESVFSRLSAAEAGWIQKGRSVPFGVSALVVARRPV